MSYLASLNPLNLVAALPGCVAQGLIWGIMALGVFVTFRLLDFADLTVDGSFATGGAVTIMLTLAGMPVGLSLFIAVLAGLASGLVRGLVHTKLEIPPILSGILVQIALCSVNLDSCQKQYDSNPGCTGSYSCTDRASVLVLRYRDRFRYPCYRLQSGHEQG